jgi:hypothetical protein
MPADVQANTRLSAAAVSHLENRSQVWIGIDVPVVVAGGLQMHHG